MEAVTSTGLPVILLPVAGEIRAVFRHPSTGREYSMPATWGTVDGREGVIGEIYDKGRPIRVCLTVPKSAWDQVEAEREVQVAEYRARVAAAPIVAMEYVMGCDAGDTYTVQYGGLDDVPFDFLWERLDGDQERFRAFLQANPKKSIFEGTEPIEATITSYGGHRWTGKALQQLLDAISEFEAAQVEAAAQKKAEQEARIAALLEKARATGEPQVIRRWVTPECTEHLPDCSFDQAMELAMPDGTINTKYYHCY